MTPQMKQFYLEGKSLEEVVKLTEYSEKYIKTCYTNLTLAFTHAEKNRTEMRLLQVKAMEQHLFENINEPLSKFKSLRDTYARFTI